MGGNCRKTIGLKDGKKTNLDIKFNAGQNETLYQIYVRTKSTYYENVIDQHKYPQTDDDMKVFKNIIDLITPEQLSQYKYFIITKNNYYIFNEHEGAIYKYNKSNNSLELLVKDLACDIDYFIEN
jgi:TRAP-type uncharacterized transport system substrate-binding protein